MIWVLDWSWVGGPDEKARPVLGRLDHGSRACLELGPVESRRTVALLRRLLDLFDRFGTPKVLRTDNEPAARSVISAFQDLDAPFLVQEFVAEAKGADVRLLVVGGKVVAAMKRQAKEGEFRSNLHRGGEASLIKITPEERSTAVRAANVMGLNVAGVDILRSNHGPVVMEVNSSPGLEGIENATGKDVAGMIIEFIEKNAKPYKTKTRGKG